MLSQGLTFKNGSFIHEGTPLTLKAAADIRHLSDNKAKRIFDQAFSCRYPMPHLPKLSFLDAHQIEGIKWILTRKRSYLAHAPGAGKTAQAIIAAKLSEGLGKTIFIVPPSLTINWRREIEKFSCNINVWPDAGIIPTSERQQSAPWRADILIVPDSMLTRRWVYERLMNMPIKFIAVDEASRFKEPTSQRTKALFNGLMQKARHAVLMDGSPMPNRPMELWAPTFAMDPEAIDCMDMSDFGFAYCGAKLNDRGVWEFTGASRLEQLQGKLQRSFMHVVGESKLKHPERQRSMLFMDQDVRSKEHKTWERKHLGELEFNDDTQGELARFRRQLGIKKIPFVARYVRERLTNKNESILLFAWHREVCEGLAKELSEWKPGVVMGGVSNDQRENIFRDFQSGKTKIIIGNISAMGRGHNLQRADRIIFAEFSWTDELNKQCEKRASRRGNDRAFVRCEYIVAPNSMDEKVLASVFTKAKRVEKVIGE